MAGDLTVQLDASAIAALGDRFAAAHGKTAEALRLAVNRAGDMARTAMVRSLVPQTGLKRKVVTKALTTTRASGGSGAYTIKSKGGNIRLKYFAARETRAGVSAAPWSSRRTYAHTFMKGGRFPNRVSLNMGGHAFRRMGKGRLPIESARSGLFIAEEMVKGASAEAFHGTAQRVLTERLGHELLRILGAV